MTTTQDLSVALLLGDTDDAGGAARVEELKLATPVTADGVVDALKKTSITPSDVRSRVELVIPPTAESIDATVLHATLAGYIGRFLPVRLADGDVTPIERDIPTGPRPEAIATHLDVNPYTDLSHPQVHYARRVTVDITEQGTKDALTLVNRVAAVRRRPRFERLPDVTLAGAEPVRLEDARKAGLAHRSETRARAQGTVTEREETSKRLLRLEEAAAAPIAETLTRLGATHDETGEKWHCTRPERHNNGDQNPSLKIVDGKTRCFRCDPEWVDSLRLVIDTLGLSPDEAATWIESGEARAPLH